MNFTVLEVPQRSPEWRTARLGRLTGSSAGDMLAVLKDGKPAAGRRNLLLRLVLERLTNKSHESDFVSAAMQAGIDREADAIGAYEVATGQIVQTCGFLAHTSLMAGCSLDGHVDDFDTLISVKCRQPDAHWEFLRKGTIPKDAWSQMAHELWITDALEHTYVSFNPDFPERLQLKHRTFKRDDFDIAGYETAALQFLADVDREIATMAGWAA